MFTTLALLSTLTLAPGQAGELKLTNPRGTYGVLGALRTDTKILPGDVYFVTFDIENLKMDDEGKIVYSMGMELINPKGQTEYKRDPQERAPIFNVLGGTRIPAFVHAKIGTDQEAGEYTLKVTVIDGTTKKSQSLEQKFTVLKKGFGLVELTASYDSNGALSAPFGGIAGQSLFINFWIVGFERAKGQPNIAFEMRVFDEKNQPTLKKPMSGGINSDVPADFQRVPMNVIIPLLRPGKFTVQLKATDTVTRKVAELKFPITVVELK